MNTLLADVIVGSRRIVKEDSVPLVGSLVPSAERSTDCRSSDIQGSVSRSAEGIPSFLIPRSSTEVAERLVGLMDPGAISCNTAADPLLPASGSPLHQGIVIATECNASSDLSVSNSGKSTIR